MVKMIVLAAMMSTSCAGSASQVEVKGDESSALALAGDWEGTYVGVDSGRRGTIRFSLTAGHHTAEGVVLMYSEDDAGERQPQPLAIEFVEVAKSGGLSGKIGTYTDPQCQCQMQAEFLGDFQSKDAISGTFTTHELDGRRRQSGRWSVERK